MELGELALRLFVARVLVVREEFFAVVGEVVRVEGERRIFEAHEPLDALLGALKAFFDVLLDDAPASHWASVAILRNKMGEYVLDAMFEFALTKLREVLCD